MIFTLIGVVIGLVMVFVGLAIGSPEIMIAGLIIAMAAWLLSPKPDEYSDPST